MSSSATATSRTYTLSLHDALPISLEGEPIRPELLETVAQPVRSRFAEINRSLSNLGGSPTPETLAHWFETVIAVQRAAADRKSTRLNSSHANISYAVFFLKKKKII